MYIIPRARPWPGINRKRSPFPHFSSCVSAFSCLKLMSVTNSQPCRWSHAGLTRIASLCLAPLSHPHTHTLSLSPSLSGSGITTTHTAPRPAQRAFSFRGRRSVYLILSHFRTCAWTPTPQYIMLPAPCNRDLAWIIYFLGKDFTAYSRPENFCTFPNFLFIFRPRLPLYPLCLPPT